MSKLIQHCPSTADCMGPGRANSSRKTLPKETTTALKTGRTFTVHMQSSWTVRFIVVIVRIAKCDGRMTADQSGKVLDSDPVIQQFFYAPKHKTRTHTGTVWNADPDLDARSVVQCRTSFAHFGSTRAKSDVRIRTFGPRDANPDPDLWIRTGQKFIKTRNEKILIRELD